MKNKIIDRLFWGIQSPIYYQITYDLNGKTNQQTFISATSENEAVIKFQSKYRLAQNVSALHVGSSEDVKKFKM